MRLPSECYQAKNHLPHLQPQLTGLALWLLRTSRWVILAGTHGVRASASGSGSTTAATARLPARPSWT